MLLQGTHAALKCTRQLKCAHHCTTLPAKTADLSHTGACTLSAAARPRPLAAVGEWVKQNVHCPYIITRREAVVNARMKISSQLPQCGGGSPRQLE